MVDFCRRNKTMSKQKITRNVLENLLKEITAKYEIHFDMERTEEGQLIIYTDRKDDEDSWDLELKEF
jgi:hypothetical protein